MERRCTEDTLRCLQDCRSWDRDCPNRCISDDPTCRACVTNNYRHCALHSDGCGELTREWICCLEPLGCYGRAYDEDCQAACNPEPYLACLESIDCSEDVDACFF